MRRIRLFCLVSTFFFLAGCWSAHEPSDLTLASAIAIDSLQNDQVCVFYELVNPEITAETGGSNPVENATRVLYESAETVAAAENRLESKIGKRLTLGQATCLVIGQNLASIGIVPVMDYVFRQPEMRTSVHVVVTDRPAGDLLTTHVLKDTAATEITGLMMQGLNTGFIDDVSALDVARDLSSPGIEPIVPLVSLVPLQQASATPDGSVGAQQMMIAQNMCVFDHDRLAGVLSPTESRGLLLMRDALKSAVYHVCASGSTHPVAIRLTRIKAQTHARASAHSVECLSSAVRCEAEVIGKPASWPPEVSRKWVEAIERASEAAIRSEIAAAMQTLQHRFQIDAVGFGQMIYRRHPVLWRTLETDWNRMFSTARFEVDVSVRLKATGTDKSGFTGANPGYPESFGRTESIGSES